MFEVRILLDQLDYDSLAEVLVPLLAESMKNGEKGGILGEVLARNPDTATSLARTVLSKMSPEKKDELLLQMLGKYREKLVSAGQHALDKHRLGAQLVDVTVRKI